MTVLAESSARDRILEGACELFALRGYQAIGLRDLAAYVGLKPGSLYHHIESKQSLLFELMEDAISELLHLTRLNLRCRAHPAERLNCFIDTFLAFRQSAPSRAHLLSREQINLTPEQTADFRQLKCDYIKIFSDIIKDLTPISRHHPLTLSMAADAVIGMLFNQAQWLETEVSAGLKTCVLKQFAYGIITMIDTQAA